MTTTATGPSPEVSSPVWIRFGERERQSRLTVFFRIILLIPQYIVIYFLQLALFFAAIFAWFAALVTGRVPESLAAFMTGVIRWVTRVEAYGVFLTGRYPPFALESKPDYPVDIAVQSGPLNRLAVLFRIILVIPAAVLSALLVYGLGIFAIVMWVAALILGELPESFFGAASAVIRFQTRVNSYFVMLTSYYPDRLMGDPAPAPVAASVPGGEESAPAPAPSPWELVLSQGARALVVVFIVLGVGVLGVSVGIQAAISNTSSTLGSLETGLNKTVIIQDASDAYGGVAKAATTFSSSVQSCGTSVSCVQGSAATFAAALGVYATKIGSLNVPASAVSAQQAAEQAARQAAAELTSLNSATSYQALAQQVGASQFSSTLSAVDTTFNKLQMAVANGS